MPIASLQTITLLKQLFVPPCAAMMKCEEYSLASPGTKFSTHCQSCACQRPGVTFDWLVSVRVRVCVCVCVRVLRVCVHSTTERRAMCAQSCFQAVCVKRIWQFTICSPAHTSLALSGHHSSRLYRALQFPLK